MRLSNSVYDVLKWVATILLPAVATLYYALARIWGLPAPSEVVGTITAIDTFIGVLIGISSKNYVPVADGVIHVTDEGEAYASFEKMPIDSVGSTVTLDVKRV